jgi:GTP pyrophosphokinase
MSALPQRLLGDRFEAALAWAAALHRTQLRKGSDVPYVSHLLAVAAIVEGCTDTDTTPKPPWKERKEAYLRHLAIAPPSVLLVSCADKLHNVRSTVGDLAVAPDREAYWKRFNGGKEGSLWYYRSLGRVFLQRLPGRLSDELARAVLEMTSLTSGPLAG